MTTMQANILNPFSPEGMAAMQGHRPFINKQTKQVQILTPRGLQVNSLLRKDEWEQLDSAVVSAATQRLNGVMDLFTRGQTFRLGSIGSLLAQYNQASEMEAASITISGRTRGDQDRVDFKLVSVPVPVFFKSYSFGAREQAAARNLGDSVDTSNASAAARVVAEGVENMLFNGNTTIVLNNNSIYGYTTHPNRNTGTGSDWGTVANVVTDVRDMINDAQADNHFGPYFVYAATTQFNQARNTFFTDGSGDSGFDRVMRMSGIEGFFASDFLTAGEAVLVQMDSEVVDLAFVPGFGINVSSFEDGNQQTITGVTNLEWLSGDGMVSYFKTLAIMVPRVKDRYDGKSGIVHYTGL